MARYARGKWSKAQDDRTGWKVSYKDLKTEWTGVRVHKSEWEPKHPQLDPPRRINDPQALSNPRPDTSNVNATVDYNYHFANQPITGTFSLGWYLGNDAFGISVSETALPTTVSIETVGNTIWDGGATTWDGGLTKWDILGNYTVQVL